MASGGYQAPSLEEPTGFGSDSVPDDRRGSAMGGVASAPLFGIDYKRHEDLKIMLDGNKDGQKLDAMKIIIGMIAKGKDCSDLFPAVVKNVVSKNSEIKKLVYVYLVRYAEEQQDLALLSISTFQKGLKDPNQLIRASALRVLSSIRVPIIAPIMMLAIKESVTDMSPYVRRTAAHAIPKLYSMDPEQKEQLVEVIEKLLKDQTTLVAGSVVMAFETVCPERIDLIHKNYRKLCSLIVDVDEWGQVTILNMLTRYARTQFLDPNKELLEDAPFYSDSDSDESDDEEGDEKEAKPPKKKPYVMDPDLRLLLRNAKPLLQSRNAAVVMAVAQLYHHIAPRNEAGITAKPLIRLLKNHSEVQSIVLSNIATISAERPNMFEPYLKSFFVHASDPTHIRLLKLDIIANIAGETSIHTILREFRTYIASQDKQFAAATIHAIGRVACSIPEVTETCLHGLMSLLSHKNEVVVAESVVVIKKLLQLQPKENKDLIVQVAKLMDTVTVPMAKASILWLVGEYCSLVPKISPDVLRKAAKNFPNEGDIVKLQTVNLAAKLCIANAKQSKLLCQYVLNLAKYDQNYDIRDRARFLRQLVLPDEATALSKYAKKILLASKPAPVLESPYKGRSQWQLGSLSHMVNAKTSSYLDLPDFPEEAPDPAVREVEGDPWWGKQTQTVKKKNFYEDTESESSDFYSSISGSEESGSESGSEDSSEEGSSDESVSGSEGEEEESGSEERGSGEEDTSSDEGDVLENLKKRFIKPKQQEDSESESESDDSSDDTSEETSSEEEPSPKPKPTQPKKEAAAAKKKDVKPTATSNESSLLILDDWDALATPSSPMTPASMATGDMLKPLATGMEDLSLVDKTKPFYQIIDPFVVPSKTHDLLNRIAGQGLSVKYHFTRKPHLASSKMLGLELIFQNTLDSGLSGIAIGSMRLQAGMRMKDTSTVMQLTAGSSRTVTVGIDFNDTLQPAKFDICVSPGKKYPVQIEPLAGELLRAIHITETDFLTFQDKLTGMHESSDKVTQAAEPEAIKTAVLEVVNMAPVETMDTAVMRFAGVTFSSSLPVLLTIQFKDSGLRLTVNSEKMVINSMILKTVKGALGTI